MSAHTQTPWSVRGYPTEDGGYWIDCDAWTKSGKSEGGTLATCHLTGTGNSDPKSNADFIVKACNLHDDLVDVLARCLPYIATADCDPLYKFGSVQPLVKRIRALIEKADAS